MGKQIGRSIVNLALVNLTELTEIAKGLRFQPQLAHSLSLRQIDASGLTVPRIASKSEIWFLVDLAQITSHSSEQNRRRSIFSRLKLID